MSEPFVFIRQNHLPSQCMQSIKQDFYRIFDGYHEELTAYARQKEKLREQLSGCIESEPEARIAYIRLQQGLKKGRVEIDKIPKLDRVDTDLVQSIQSHLLGKQELDRKADSLRRQFECQHKQQEELLYELFRTQRSVQNALLLTNFEMYCSLNNSYNSKKSGKVWKIMMRSFAKTAPLSSYTSNSILGDNKAGSRINMAQWILLALFDYFLLLPEVIRISRFRVAYELEPGGKALMTTGSGEPKQVSQGLYQREKRRFRMTDPRLQELSSGSIVTFGELAAILGEDSGQLDLTVRKLLAAGYLRNTLESKAEHLTLASLIDEISSFRIASERLDRLVRHLEALHQIAGRMEQTAEVHRRESLVRSAQKHVADCCETVMWKGKYPLDPFNEDSYMSIKPHEIKHALAAEEALEKWSGIFPLFDYRLMFRRYMGHLLKDRLPASYSELRQTLSGYADVYEKEAAPRRSFRGTLFETSEDILRHEQLKDRYRELLRPAESGKDVALNAEDILALKSGLKEMGITRSATAQLLIQPAKDGKYVVNDFKNSYLAYSIYHDPDQHERILRRIRAVLECDDAVLLTYSPSCGFNPNVNGFADRFYLTNEPPVMDNGTFGRKAEPVDLNECQLEWNEAHNRFELRAENLRGIALYTGSLAPACLPEDYRNIALLSQSGFLNGSGLEYNEISLDDSRKVGRISVGDLIIQRRRHILSSGLIENLTCDLDGYSAFHEVLKAYGIPVYSFVRLFPVRQGRLHIEYGATGIHKPIFFDAEEPLYFIEMLKHIQRSRKQYGELAVVLEEALPNPYETEYTAEYVYEM
ncbi:hypothetical protein GRF59_18775 [Paenibacillus sp. HJL G12]|uniref:Lantibiotic dehydratase N-terminal domain-containing protein n=1 Tax=Paenibacillus dendrobii TaxID=2691084 RepID=A0A7X3ILM2_9BACL|nr:hypothetical protein [Paenibacillus dendrobii]